MSVRIPPESLSQGIWILVGRILVGRLGVADGPIARKARTELIIALVRSNSRSCSNNIVINSSGDNNHSNDNSIQHYYILYIIIR